MLALTGLHRTTWHTVVTLVMVLLLSSQSHGQLELDGDGKVKIGSGIAWPSGVGLLELLDDGETEARIYATSADNSRLWTMNQLYAYGFGIDGDAIGHIWADVNDKMTILDFDSEAHFSINHSIDHDYHLVVGGNVLCTGDYYGSDKRFKEDIKPISNAVDKLSLLSGVSFRYSDGCKGFVTENAIGTSSYGVIAQEVDKVFPELVRPMSNVSESGGEDYLAVNYVGLIPALIEAIKEQQAQLNALQEELDGLRLDNGSSGPSKKLIDQFNNTEDLFSITPNPTSGSITIKLSESTQKFEGLEFKILDATGKLIWTKELTQTSIDSFTTNIDDIRSGSYIGVLQSGNSLLQVETIELVR